MCSRKEGYKKKKHVAIIRTYSRKIFNMLLDQLYVSNVLNKNATGGL
jgi:hypothetical protein